jgi:hypothetical protein
VLVIYALVDGTRPRAATIPSPPTTGGR